MKKILTFGLLALAVVGLGFAVNKRMTPNSEPVVAEAAVPESQTTPSSAGEADGEADGLPSDGVVVTYFTTDVRCPSCHKIEDLTHRTVETRFADELASGKLVFRTLNVDNPANRHFVDDYQLVSKTVIVSQHRGGKETGWSNLQDVWLKLSSPDEFLAYVQAAIDEALKPGDA